jgi:hypothetical protein
MDAEVAPSVGSLPPRTGGFDARAAICQVTVLETGTAHGRGGLWVDHARWRNLKLGSRALSSSTGRFDRPGPRDYAKGKETTGRCRLLFSQGSLTRRWSGP